MGAIIATAPEGSSKSIVLTSAAGVLKNTKTAPATDNATTSLDCPARIGGVIADRMLAGVQGSCLTALRLPALIHGDEGSQFAPLYLAVAECDLVSRYVGTAVIASRPSK